MANDSPNAGNSRFTPAYCTGKRCALPIVAVSGLLVTSVVEQVSLARMGVCCLRSRCRLEFAEIGMHGACGEVR